MQDQSFGIVSKVPGVVPSCDTQASKSYAKRYFFNQSLLTVCSPQCIDKGRVLSWLSIVRSKILAPCIGKKHTHVLTLLAPFKINGHNVLVGYKQFDGCLCRICQAQCVTKRVSY